MQRSDLYYDLIRPFPAREIEWRVGSRSKDKTRGAVLAYIDARHVMHRLDELFGLEWQCRYLAADLNGAVICEIGLPADLLTGDGDPRDFIWRSDGAGETGMEGQKGKMSDAFKRAAVRWGIGRYLYRLKAPWIQLENGYMPRDFTPPALPSWATPEGFDKLREEGRI